MLNQGKKKQQVSSLILAMEDSNIIDAKNQGTSIN